MPASATATAERDPRRARSLTPGEPPRRGELAAALALVVLLAHLLLAQLALLLALALDGAGRAARWRPLWLAGPAAAGFLWALAIGPGRALAGFTAGPHQVLAYLAGSAGQPARVLHPARAFAGLRHWLPRQAPLALILASAEAAAWWWLRGRRAGAGALPPPRPGLIVAVRRQFTAARVRSGGVVSRTGACLGTDRRTGRPAGISWPAAEGGVLVTGAAAAEVSEASFQLVHAAIRRRKPVVVVDLGAAAGLPGALARVCADAGAPLHVFGPDGPGCYEPLRGGDPARKAGLVMGMIDWDPVADQARRMCGAYLNDLFAVAAAAPAHPGVPVLDDVIALLAPAALRARMRQVPPYHPRRGPLGERVRVSASLLEADPGTAAFLGGELTGLRASALGRWLRPGTAPAGPSGAGPAGPPGAGPGGAPGAPGAVQISLSGMVRERAVAYFPLSQPRYGRSARMIATLVALDLAAVFAESQRLGIGGDGLAWFGGVGVGVGGGGGGGGGGVGGGGGGHGNGDVIAAPALAQLISTGAGAGLATVVSTVAGPVVPGPAPPQAAVQLAGHIPGQITGQIAGLANVLLIRGPGDPGLEDVPLDSPLASDEFTLVVKSPERQVVPRGRFVPGWVP